MNNDDKKGEDIKFILPDYSGAVEKTVDELKTDPDIDELSYDDYEEIN